MKARQPAHGMTRQEAIASNLAILVEHACKKQRHRLRRSKPLQRPRADSTDLMDSPDASTHSHPHARPPLSGGSKQPLDSKPAATTAPTIQRSLSSRLGCTPASTHTSTGAPLTTKRTSQPAAKKAKSSSGGDAVADVEYNTTDTMALDKVVSCLVQ